MLLTLFSFSFFSLTFVGIMPVIADYNLGIGPKSVAYGLLYATFGLGAALGARHRRLRVRPPVEGAARCARRSSRSRSARGLRALLRMCRARVPGRRCARVHVLPRDHVPVDAHPIAPRRRRTRRVMALWIMVFGGTVPLGVLVGGWVGHATSITAVFLVGAVWAVVLAAWSNAGSLRAKGAPDV